MEEAGAATAEGVRHKEEMEEDDGGEAEEEEEEGHHDDHDYAFEEEEEQLPLAPGQEPRRRTAVDSVVFWKKSRHGVHICSPLGFVKVNNWIE